MNRWRFAVAALSLVLLPTLAAAAPTGKVVIAQGVDPSTLDTMNQSETPASNIAINIWDTLYERDARMQIVPLLAAAMPKLVAPTTWEVTLRKGVKFHNGEEFDAESVKFSLERLAQGQGKLRGASFFAPIDRVEVVNPQTVRVHTRKPWPTFTVVMTFNQASMYPPKAYKDKDSAAISRQPIGTGPYKFVRWAKDEEIVLEANEQYFRGAPKIKTVVFRPIPDDAVRVAALQNGEIDIAVNIPPHLASIIDKHPKVFLSTAPSIRTIQLMFYTHQMDKDHKPTGPYPGPTADKRVRQAIAYAVDVDEIVKSVLDGKGVPVALMLTSMHFGFDPKLKPIKQDLARTKKLLAEAGYPNGVEITLNAPQGRYVRDKEVAEAVGGQLSKAGIRTTVRTFEFVNYLNNMVYVHKAGPVWLIGWGTPTMDAETVYVPLFKSPGIFVNWHNEDFNRMVEEAQTITDEKRRLEQYHRINKLWLEEMPAVPLYQQLDLYGANRRLNWKARSDEVIKAYDMSIKEGS
ncbi:MAG TPA: ABC transporter substrate-binding protein [Candidatus Tectomicrobia bacterium]|nr:ABC transporter substrate-binding protein [Candidatus Tectomicrobia bacterium]